jgi:hypothetical protein
MTNDQPGLRDPHDPDDQFSPAEGPSPSNDDADEGEALEVYISEMDHSLGVDDHTTVTEQVNGDTIDDRTRREQPQNERRQEHVDLTDDSDVDGLDDEAALVGDSAETFEPDAPEVDAMHVVDNLPGGVDHPDDYVED